MPEPLPTTPQPLSASAIAAAQENRRTRNTVVTFGTGAVLTSLISLSRDGVELLGFETAVEHWLINLTTFALTLFALPVGYWWRRNFGFLTERAEPLTGNDDASR